MKKAQFVFLERAQANGQAQLGQYPNGIKNTRKIFVGGNWKCNGDVDFISEFPHNILNNLRHDVDQVDVVVAPTTLHLMMVKQILNDKVLVCTQNISMTGMGAYTGELSAKQVKEIGVKHTLIGHSERRTLFKETDQEVA